MIDPGFIYLIALVGMYVAVYLSLRWFLPLFFCQPVAPVRCWRPVFLIAALATIIFALSLSISHEVLANRFLHAIGGGLLATFVCFLAAKDSRLKITRLQFIAASLLIVTALGVGNELVEFLLQIFTGFPFTDSLIDTWLDLMSNTVGIIIGLACITPFIRTSEKAA